MTGVHHETEPNLGKGYGSDPNCNVCHKHLVQYYDDFYGDICKFCYWRRVLGATHDPWTGKPLVAEPRCPATDHGVHCRGAREHTGEHWGVCTRENTDRRADTLCGCQHTASEHRNVNDCTECSCRVFRAVVWRWRRKQAA